MLEEPPFDIVQCDFNLGATKGIIPARDIRKPGGIGNPNVPLPNRFVSSQEQMDRATEILR
jgi:hypothetical protein